MAEEMIEDYKAQIAHNVRAAREKKGWTQVQLCMASGVPQTTLSKIERLGAPFTFNTIYLLCDALGCTAHDLIPPTSNDVAEARAAALASVQ
jgi:transcriptional regulator with XRE-family HTH domain